MSRVNEIFRELTEDRSYFHPKGEKIRELNEKIHELTNEELLELFRKFVETDVFRWLNFIGYKIPEIASLDDGFIGLLKKIADKIKTDMAQGPFINALIDLGKNKPEFTLELFRKIKETGDDLLVLYGGFLLGGFGHKKFKELFDICNREFDKANPFLKAAFIRALTIAHNEKKEMKKSNDIFKILEESSQEGQDGLLKNEVVLSYFDFYKFEPKKCFKGLKKLAEKGDTTIRFQIVRRLFTTELELGHKYELVKICSKDENSQVLNDIIHHLLDLCESRPEEVFEIFKDWVKDDKYFKIHSTWFLEQLGEKSPPLYLGLMERWIEEEEDSKTRWFFYIILNELSVKDPKTLIETLEGWFEKNDEGFDNLIIKTIEEFLGSIYENYQGRKEEIRKCKALLEKLVDRRSVALLPKKIHEEIKYCFYLIKELNAIREDLDYEVIEKNLQEYPALKEFMGETWFEKKKGENDRTHPLLVFLSRNVDPQELNKFVKKFKNSTDPEEKWGYATIIRHVLYPSAFLRQLDKCLRLIDKGEKGTKGLRQGLNDEEKFSQTISEIETVYFLRKKYGIKNVEIEPVIKVEEEGKIKSKYLDCAVKINDAPLLIEVVNPDMMDKLKYSSRAMFIKNRAIEIIYQEFAKKHRLKKALNIDDVPLIFVMDRGRSEIDSIHIESTFVGSPQITMLFDKKSGKAVGHYPSRAKDSLHYTDISTKLISGILYFKNDLGDNGEIVFDARFISNPHAKNPIDGEVVRELEEMFS